MLDRNLASEAEDAALIPDVPMGTSIPKIIHRIYDYPDPMPAQLVSKIEELRANNPDWDHRVYDRAAMEQFIVRHYGPAVLARFRKIGPHYGAVRADMFRYLVIHQCGGVYLDIKSMFTRPIDDVIEGSEGFIVSRWDNAPGEEHERWGIHPELKHLSRGEIQQWHVIAAAGHPFLKRTIANMLGRIDRYRPWRDHVGWLGVLKLTGPIAYTLDIEPLLARHRHTAIRDQREIGLAFTVFTDDNPFRVAGGHYNTRHQPVIEVGGVIGMLADAYAYGRKVKRSILKQDIAGR